MSLSFKFKKIKESRGDIPIQYPGHLISHGGHRSTNEIYLGALGNLRESSCYVSKSVWCRQCSSSPHNARQPSEKRSVNLVEKKTSMSSNFNVLVSE